MSPPSDKSRIHLVLKLAGLAIVWLFGLIVTAWTFGAIYFDGPFGAAPTTANLVLAVVWLLFTTFLVFFLRQRGWRRFLIWAACFLVVYFPWLSIRPSHDHDYQSFWLQTGSSKTEGDTLTFYNFRNFDYDLEGNHTERWTTKTVHWSNLRGLDFFLDAFGGDLLAHPLLSFDFGTDGHICLSVETRREEGESFSTFGGLYKMFELQYIFGSEEDFIRNRTAMYGNPVHIYRTTFSPAMAKRLLDDSLEVLNQLKEKPRFYNVLSANCTTSYRAQTPAKRREKFDIRMLLNGKFDEYLIEKGILEGDGIAFEELRKRTLINEVALQENDSPGFSAAIREGRPGFSKAGGIAP